jgi:predicted amidohydrolase YtcJ
MTTTVFRNGAVFTADAARSWASAVAVVDGRIAAVGGSETVAPYLRQATRWSTFKAARCGRASTTRTRTR